MTILAICFSYLILSFDLAITSNRHFLNLKFGEQVITVNGLMAFFKLNFSSFSTVCENNLAYFDQ